MKKVGEDIFSEDYIYRLKLKEVSKAIVALEGE